MGVVSMTEKDSRLKPRITPQTPIFNTYLWFSCHVATTIIGIMIMRRITPSMFSPFLMVLLFSISHRITKLMVIVLMAEWTGQNQIVEVI